MQRAATHMRGFLVPVRGYRRRFLTEEQDDYLNMAQELVNIDDGTDKSREWPIDHPHLLSFPRERPCLPMLVHVVAL